MDFHDSQILRWMITLVVDLHYPFNMGFPGEPEDRLKIKLKPDFTPPPSHNIPAGSEFVNLSEFFKRLQETITMSVLTAVSVDWKG